MNKSISPSENQIAFSPTHASQVLDVSRRTVDDLVKAGHLKARKIGRRVYIDANSVRALVEGDSK